MSDFATARARIVEYARDVRSIPKEAGRVTRFAVLLSKAFGEETRAAEDFAASKETGVTYRVGTAVVRRGRIDAMLGDAVIEFKVDLARDLRAAEDALKRYLCALWGDDPAHREPFTAIATDGVRWVRYEAPPPSAKSLRPDRLELQLCDEFRLDQSDEAADAFFWFVHRNLLRGRPLEPSPATFAREFGPTGPVYARAMRELREAWRVFGERPDVALAREQWSKYLRYAYGSEVGEPDLYLRHTYLAYFARFLAWVAIAPNRETADLAEATDDVIDGRAFTTLRVSGPEERDIFHWVQGQDVHARLAPIWRRLLGELRQYDLRRLDADVLKVLYERLVDPRDRHDLGEYYTPDWLCEEIVDHLYPERGGPELPAVLDPTCGSGSFLRVVVRRGLDRLKAARVPKGERAERVLNAITGFDIHPLAVLVARANLLVSLGELVPKSKRPLSVPIYLTDALLDYAGTNGDMYERGIKVKIGDPPLEPVSFPLEIAGASGAYDALIGLAVALAGDATDAANASDVEAVQRRIARAVTDARTWGSGVLAETAAAVLALGRQMAELHARQHDTFWGFVARNFARPSLMRHNFDLVLGNPPWLSFRYIKTAAYKERLQELGIDRYHVSPTAARLRTQAEIATVFLAHAATRYLKRQTGRLGFVMPRSVFTADQHGDFRRPGVDSPFRVAELWDLAEVQPVFNVPACVVFAGVPEPEPEVEPEAERAGDVQPERRPIPGRVYRGRLPQQECSVQLARDRLAREAAEFRLVTMGKRAVWTADGNAREMLQASEYYELFHQGATLVPRNFFFVETPRELPEVPDDPEHVLNAFTDLARLKTAKLPWKNFRLRGQVERAYWFRTALAEHVLPFAIDGPLPWVVLPFALSDDDDPKPHMLTVKELRDDGWEYATKYFKEAERLWEENRPASASKRTATLVKQLDYAGKLTRQPYDKRYVVIYNAAGTHLAATWLDRKPLAATCVIDAKLYGFGVSTRTEANYLITVLNSPAVNEAVQPFKSLGLFGTRDFHKKALGVPFPKYDVKNPIHKALAALGQACRAKAERVVPTLTHKTVGHRRSQIREALADQLRDIDALVRELVPAL